MTEKRKMFLKRLGKGVFCIAATGGAYILAKGTLNLILNLLEPAKATSHDQAKAVFSPSPKKRALTSPKSKASRLGF